MLLFVEYVPYLAIGAAGLLLAFVGGEWLLNRRRRMLARTSLEEMANHSGRLASLARPLSKRMDAAVEPKLKNAAPENPETGAAEATKDSEAVENSPGEPKPKVTETTEKDSAEAVLIPTRRDPSVRIFDSAVAASERNESAA